MAKRWGPGNPLWEWKKRQKQKRSKRSKRSVRTPSGGRSMAKRRYYGRRRRRSSGGGIKSMAKKVLVGLGAATVLGPTLGAGAAFMSGAGIVGAGSAFFADKVSGMISGFTNGLTGGSSGGFGQ